MKESPQSQQPVYERFYQNSAEKARKLKVLEEERDKQLTFKPELSSSKHKAKDEGGADTPGSEVSDSSIFERFYQEHEVQQAKLEIMREEASLKGLEVCTHHVSAIADVIHSAL